MGKINEINHPLIQHKLSIIRDKNTSTKDIKELVSEVATLMTFEVTKNLELEDVKVETPICVADCKRLKGKKLAIIPILRAGLGFVEGILKVIPSAKIGHIGMYRDEETLQPVEYFCKLPNDIGERDVIVVDPMLATGGSAIDAIGQLMKKGAKKIKFMCLIAAPEGIKALNDKYPDIEIYIGQIDERLNDKGYIVPGLGDAGDRLFGTIVK